MFWHNFKYTFLVLFRNKSLLFWTFCFPIILGTLFSLAFSDIEKNETLDIIPIAIVESSEDMSVYKKAYEEIEENEKSLFAIFYVSLSEAEELLLENKIVGYVELLNPPRVVVASSGINETVLKTVTDTILEEMTIYKTLMTEAVSSPTFDGNFEEITQNIQKKLEGYEENVNSLIKDESPKHLSYTMIEFYTLIALTCLYGGILAMVSIHKNLANMSSTGKRISVAPLKKSQLILGSLGASFLTQLIGLLLLFLYTVFVLHVDYGEHFSLIFLLSILGTLAGLSLGCVIGTNVKGTENTKLGILLAITMLGSFFSGMMGITMKYVIDKNIPIINLLNPASMITDGFYSLYYYETHTRFFFHIFCLFLFSLFLLILSIKGLRRKVYDRI